MGLYDELMQRTGGAARPQAPQTFAQLQQQGMARPPGPWATQAPMGRRHTDYMGPGMTLPRGGAALPPPGYVSATDAPGRLMSHGSAPQAPPGLGGYGSQPTMVPNDAPGTPYGDVPAPPPGGYPTRPSDPPLDQNTLEEYLFQMLKDPTSTNTYKHIMNRIGADVDTDASRRGVFYSTIPGGEKAEAGSNLAVGLQQQAFGNLMGYEQAYMDWLLKTMGMS